MLIGVAALVVVAGAVLVVAWPRGSAAARKKPTLFTLTGGVADYYSDDCGARSGSYVELIDPKGATVGTVGHLVPDTVHDPGYCPYHYVIRQLPRRSSYRLVEGGIVNNKSETLGFAYLVSQNWHINTYISPHGDQAAIDALFARLDDAEATGEIDGLTELSRDAWPSGGWTPQQIVCPAPGQTLAQALDAMNPPGTLIRDRLDIGYLQATPSWKPSSGPGAGQIPPGRLYVVGDETIPTSGIPYGRVVHVDVLPDGTAVLFPLGCGTTLHHNE